MMKSSLKLISGRPLDPSAIRLAQRLDGLPLALATAGVYLSQSAGSFNNYLELYNNSWNDLSQHSTKPVDYKERTLYSTWNVSFKQIQDQDPSAAELLKMMAYLNNQDLWYELSRQALAIRQRGGVNCGRARQDLIVLSQSCTTTLFLRSAKGGTVFIYACITGRWSISITNLTRKDVDCHILCGGEYMLEVASGVLGAEFVGGAICAPFPACSILTVIL